MGIKFRCHGCDKKLHVKTFLAGKRGVCPYCGAKIRIPKESQQTQTGGSDDDSTGDSTVTAGQKVPDSESPARRSAVAAATTPATPTAGRPSASASRPLADPITEAPESVWYVRPPSGGQYGPADGEIMRRWLDEGRVGADSLIWREGWPDWKIASSIFPSLRQAFSQGVEAESARSAAESLEDPFSELAKRPATRLGSTRSANRSMARNVAIIVALSVVCVALLVALYVVLRG